MLRLSIVCLCLAITKCMAFECPQKNGFFRDPADGHKYYECVDGRVFPFTCPENLVFDETKKSCDYDTNAKTGTPGTNPITSTHHTEVTTQKQSLDCKGKTGFMKDSANRHKFYECVNGEMISFTCPEDLVFDETKNTCDFDSSAVTPVHGSTDGHVSVDCVGKTGFFKDPQDRHKFHECTNGQMVTFTCPEDLVFDETKSTCDFDSKAVTTPSVHGSTAGHVSVDCVGKTGFFKDPQDGHKFHECVNGEMVTFTCPENLVFDETKKTCDYDANHKTPETTAGHTAGVSTHRTDIGTQSSQHDTTPTPSHGPTELPHGESTRGRHTPSS